MPPKVVASSSKGLQVRNGIPATAVPHSPKGPWLAHPAGPPRPRRQHCQRGELNAAAKTSYSDLLAQDHAEHLHHSAGLSPVTDGRAAKIRATGVFATRCEKSSRRRCHGWGPAGVFMSRRIRGGPA